MIRELGNPFLTSGTNVIGEAWILDTYLHNVILHIHMWNNS
jgi:hypothetical protein